MSAAGTEEHGIRVSVDAVGDAAWALGRSLYEPIELCAAPVTQGEDPREMLEHVRIVEPRLIAQLIAAGPQSTTPPLTVPGLMKLARQAGFTRDSGCPQHPEIIPLYDGWPDGPITAAITAYLTADRRVAVLKAEATSAEDRRARASTPDTELIAELLACPTPAAAAQLTEAYAPANPEAGE